MLFLSRKAFHFSIINKRQYCAIWPFLNPHWYLLKISSSYAEIFSFMYLSKTFLMFEKILIGWLIVVLIGLVIVVSGLWFCFFRNNHHPGKWNDSFKKYFRKCEYTRSCYLLISSNLLKRPFRKTLLCGLFELLPAGLSIYGLLLPWSMSRLITLCFYCNDINKEVDEVGYKLGI